MPRKEHIEPATTARDDKHHDGSGIVTRAQAAAAAHLTGSSVAPRSPCLTCATVPIHLRVCPRLRPHLHHFWLEFLKISWLPCFRPWPGHKRSPIVFLYNHYWHRRRTAMERLADPELCRLGSPFCSAASARSGSFAKCTARFDGSASDPDVLETFLDAIEVYKECLNINDEHALRGLPILLTGNAAVWWRGIKSTVSTWPDAVYKLRSMYGVPRPAHKILGYFLWNRVPCAPIFITRVRALFAKLPYELSEITKIDIVYGLLDRRIRKRVPPVTTKAGAADRVSAPGRLPVPAASSGRRARHSFIASAGGRAACSAPSMSHAASSRVTPRPSTRVVLLHGVARRRITVTRIRALFEYTAAKIDEGTMLSPPERDDLARLLQEYQDIFTQGEDRRRLRNIALIPVTTLLLRCRTFVDTLQNSKDERQQDLRSRIDGMVP
ncbi:Activity-regulated cytoskeleton associated protein 2 [Eumeta japonica]|uniref:Activity-regulated cytoskeleton associated protein 2 n=1 Tax=Eumeta variegata TaxID=151549 RepID=A0A4C1ZE72_EUMVA|nr:Activity-regulated cytoskeleton associated protein 2 [Eumeta japonica]